MVDHIRGTAKVVKFDDDAQRAFGWGYVYRTAKGEQVEDHSGDFVDDPSDFEDAVYEFALASREANAMHKGEAVGRMIESVFLTKDKASAMGLPDGTQLGWWLGIQVDDADVWKRIRAGELGTFSIEGVGEREPVEA